MAGLLTTQPKKSGLLASAPVDYKGTLGDVSGVGLPSFNTKTSTQAIPDAGSGQFNDLVKETIGLPLRAGIQAGLTLAPQKVRQNIGTINPEQDFGKFASSFIGKAPISAGQTDIPNITQNLKDKGYGDTAANLIANIGFGGNVAFGLLPLVGGLEKQGTRVVGDIIKVATEKEATTLLTKSGIPEDVAKLFAPRAVAAKTTEDVKILFSDIASHSTSDTRVTPLKYTENINDLSTKITDRYPHVPGPMADQLAEDARTLVTDGGRTPEQAIASIEDRATKLPPQAVIEQSTQNIVDKISSGQQFPFGSREVPQEFLQSAVKEWQTNYVPKIESSVELETKLSKTTDALEGMNLHREIGAIRQRNTALEDSFVKDILSSETPFGTAPISNLTHVLQEPGALDAAVAHPTPSTIPEGTTPQSEIGTSTITPSASLEEVKHIPTDLATPFKQVVDIGTKSTTEPTLYRRTVNKLSGAFRSVVEYVQDSEVRVRKLMENPEMKVTDTNNAYQKATLYPGRVASKVEDARVQMESLANDIVDMADKSGRDIPAIRSDVNEYLQATHAPERNAALGDGAAGMTNEQAAKTLERINALPEAEAIRTAAEQIRKLNEQGLALLRDSGVISEDFFKTLTEKYPNHVPLHRVFDTEEIQGALSVRGFDVKSSGIKRAKGSEREVADIMSNVQHNYEQAVLRSEKNIVDQATLAFVRDNREALAGLMEVRKPRAIGKTFDDKILMERTNDPSYLQMYENGKPIWVKITDPALALAFRGVAREKLPSLLTGIGAFTRFYAGLATRFNPEFALPNKIRDLQETMIYLAAQKDVGFKGAAKLLTKDPSSTKAVWDSIRGMDSAGARAYEEMKAMGGTTGGFGLSTRKQTEFDLDNMIDTAKSRPKQAAADVIKYIDNWNTVFEDSTRLSVYKQALSQGASKERAAFLAKEASINFNRMGRGGPVINAIWMFSNASIQGSAKMLRALKNPKVAAATVATVASSVGAINEWNDHVDPQWRDKVTKWDRLNGLPVVLPGGKEGDFKYVVIPVSWGVKPIKVMADYAYDMASGQAHNLGKMASDLFTSVIDAYNPLSGTDAVSALTPTILDVPVEIARNLSWSGSKIHPDFDKNAPKDVQYFSSLGETASGKAFIGLTKKLQESTGIALSPADVKYAFDQYIGGAGKAGAKAANTAIGLSTGKPPSADEYPFISRFYRTRTQEEIGQGAGGDTAVLKSVLENQSRDRFYATQAAEDKYTQLKALAPTEAAKQWEEINKKDPTLGAKITSIAKDDKKGLDYTERLIGQLGVVNGERALYLKGKFDELKSNTDKAALWKSYSDKGLITAQVADQISYLLKNPQ